jgi:hypothetical protein
MANQLSGNPYVLDSVGDIFAEPGQQSCRTCISHFEYVDYPNVSDQVTLHDDEGRVIWSTVGNADFAPVVSQDIGWVKGITVVALTAPGRILVYLRP